MRPCPPLYAELYAAVEAAEDAIWFRELLSEIGFPQSEPTPVWVDNASRITLASQFPDLNTVDGLTKPLAGPTAMFPKRDLLLGIAL